MLRYLKFRVQTDLVYTTPTNVYFKLRAINSNHRCEEVFVSEEHFSLLLKIMQHEGQLSDLLAYDSFGAHFTQIIIDTQDQHDLIDILDMHMLLEKNSAWISWPSKIEDLTFEWEEDWDLQDQFPSVEEFISSHTDEELWSLYEMWEISHGEKIDLTQASLMDFGAGGWALDGCYMDDPHTFVGFTDISQIEIEFFDGEKTSAMSEKELRTMLTHQYSDEANQLDILEPTSLIDRGIRREEGQKEYCEKGNTRYRKMLIYISIIMIFLGWTSGLFE